MKAGGVPRIHSREDVNANRSRIDQECVEGYLFRRRPFQILLFRRPPVRGRIWVPISGKVDPSDRNLSAALRREIAEETGFQAGRRVTSLRWVFPFRGPTGGRWRLHAFAVELATATAPRLSDEHDDYEWLEPAEAMRRLHFRDNRAALRRLLRRFGGAEERRRRRGPIRPSAARRRDRPRRPGPTRNL